MGSGAGTNPWLEIPLDDYEGHMKSAGVRQFDVLSAMFAEALARCRPASVAVIGIAGGNGLEHIDGTETRRVLGIDINPAYLQTVRQRHPNMEGLELVCVDLACQNVACAPVQLVHGALVFEHAGVGACLDNALKLVASGRWLSVVLQMPGNEGDAAPAVGNSGFASVAKLRGSFTMIDPAWFVEAVKERGFRLVQESQQALTAGKGFWMGLFARD